MHEHDDYLRARKPLAADRLLAEVERVAGLLADGPLMGSRIEGTRFSRSLVTRRFHYRIIYRVVGGDVEVLDILHPRQQP